MITAGIANKIIVLILSSLPLSLVALKWFSRFFINHNPKLGKTTTICTNVAGTLTRRKMIVRSIYFDKYRVSAKNKQFVKIEDTETKTPVILEKTELKKEPVMEIIAIAAHLCRYEKIRELEMIVIEFLLNCGFNSIKTRHDFEIITELPSSPEKKISTVVAMRRETREIMAFSKGNPRKILEKCTRIYYNNRKTELTPNLRRKVRKKIDQLNKSGQKGLAFAHKALPLKKLDNYSEEFTENEMTFMGLVGLNNPINLDIKENIQEAKRAGIKIYILSTEKEEKAVAVAKTLDMINPQYFESFTGSYLENIDKTKLKKMLANKEKDYIFAELKTPEKIKILEALRADGQYTALTSKKHNIGFKEIVEGIRKGRLANKNQDKFTYHAISAKITEFFLALLAILLGAPLALTLGSILIIDMVINLLLEFALRADDREENVMSPQYHPVNKISYKPAILNGILITLVIIGVYFFSIFRYGWLIGETVPADSILQTKTTAVIFILFAFTQILNAIHFRDLKKPLTKTRFSDNPYLFLSSVIVLMVIYIASSFFAEDLGFSELKATEWYIIGFSLIIIILLQEISKFFINRKPQNESPNTPPGIS